MNPGTREFYPNEIEILKLIAQRTAEQIKRNETAKEPEVIGLDAATLQELVPTEMIDGVEGRRPVPEALQTLLLLGALDLSRHPTTGAMSQSKFVLTAAGEARLAEYKSGKRKPKPYPKQPEVQKGDKAVQFAAESKEAIAATAANPLNTTANTGERPRGGGRRD